MRPALSQPAERAVQVEADQLQPVNGVPLGPKSPFLESRQCMKKVCVLLESRNVRAFHGRRRAAHTDAVATSSRLHSHTVSSGRS
eukprot:scaffold32520_cov108-Isochrysis_galbana.AAC.4